MKKIALLAVVAILLTGCVKKKVEDQKTNKEGKTGSKIEEFTGSLKDAMGMKVAMKCEFEQNGKITTSYIKGKNVYVESNVDGKKGYMIGKDDCTYLWGDGQPGLKVCDSGEAVEGETEDIEVEKGEFKAQGVDSSMEYKCSPAVFGDDKFDPPSDVEFSSMEDMMKGMMKVEN